MVVRMHEYNVPNIQVTAQKMQTGLISNHRFLDRS